MRFISTLRCQSPQDWVALTPSPCSSLRQQTLSSSPTFGFQFRYPWPLEAGSLCRCELELPLWAYERSIEDKEPRLFVSKYYYTNSRTILGEFCHLACACSVTAAAFRWGLVIAAAPLAVVRSPCDDSRWTSMTGN